MTANVPFSFVVDKAALPAGAYSIEAISRESSKGLVIRDAQKRAQSMVLPHSAETLNASNNTRLVFHRYGDQYFLAQIWVQGEKSGSELAITRREAEMAKNILQTEDVIVLASLR